MIIPRDEVISDVVDGVMTLCHTGSVEYFRLNETGALIWSACLERASTDVIVERLAAEYPDTSVDTLRGEVSEFLSSLVEAGLIEVVG